MTTRIVIKDNNDKRRAVRYLDGLEIVEPLEMTVKKYKANRSLAQNRLLYYWLKILVQTLFDTHGQQVSQEALKLYFKDRFLGYESKEIMGKVITHIKSTAKLGKKEFSEFLDRIDHYCVDEWGIVLPRPSDLYAEAMHNVRN